MSRAVEILSAIKSGIQYSGHTYSRLDEILKSIANETQFDREPLSRYEEILIAIKNGRGIGNQLFDESVFNQYATSATTDTDWVFNNNSIGLNNLVTGLKPNTRYTFRYTAKHVSGFPRIRFAYSNGEYSSIPVSSRVSTEYAEYIATSDSGKTVIGLSTTYSSNIANGFYILKGSVMLNEGTTSLAYEPYTGTKKPLTRIEKILFAIANNTDVPQEYYSELEKSYIDADANL